MLERIDFKFISRNSLLIPIFPMAVFIFTACFPPVQEPEPVVVEPPPGIETQETPQQITIELSGDVLFDFDKSTIRPPAEPLLMDVADVIREYPESTVIVAGHTDSVGTEEYNDRLSFRRAEAIKDWLYAEGGVPQSIAITVRGYGESRPIATNETAEGRQANRRVEITVEKF